MSKRKVTFEDQGDEDEEEMSLPKKKVRNELQRVCVGGGEDTFPAP